MRAIILILLILSFPANAGYIAVEKRTCTHGIGTCHFAIDPSNPDGSKIYQAILDNTWPTDLLNPTRDREKPEKTRIKEAIGSDEALKGHYEPIWVPDVLQDLHCTATLLKEREWALHTIPHKYHRIGSLVPKEYEQENLDDDIHKIAKDSAGNEAEEVRTYFSDLNRAGEKAFLRCNHKLGLDWVSLSSWTNDFWNHDRILEAFLRNTIDRFSAEVRRNNSSRDDQEYQPITDIDSESQIALLLLAAKLEVASEQKNEGVIYRGTKGFRTVTGQQAIDFPWRGEEGRTSLSFGTTLLAGLFRESGGGGKSACAFDYFNSTYGYALTFNKSSQEFRDLFEVPPLGLIGRLFGKGELWHTRNKIGIAGISDDDLEKCLPGCLTLLALKEYRRAGLQLNENETSDQMALKVGQYIADHVVILKHRSDLRNSTVGMPDPSVAVLDTQRDFLRRLQLSTIEALPVWMSHFSYENTEAVIAEMRVHKLPDLDTKGQMLSLMLKDPSLIVNGMGLFQKLFKPDPESQVVFARLLESPYHENASSYFRWKKMDAAVIPIVLDQLNRETLEVDHFRSILKSLRGNETVSEVQERVAKHLNSKNENIREHATHWLRSVGCEPNSLLSATHKLLNTIEQLPI